MSDGNQAQSNFDNICIAMPCSVDWNEMKGDNKVRLCGGCNKNVYNLSEMSRKEVEEVLSGPTLPCIQITRTDEGKIVTKEQPNSIRYFWSYGKTAVSAILSLFATLAPQWASAADEKNKLMLRGKPAVITPQIKQQTAQPVTPLPPGVPIYVPRNQGTTAFWPSSITGLGFTSDDLPLTISEKFSPEQFKAVDRQTLSLKSVPTQLDKEAWELFFKARKLHLKASMHAVNKELEKAVRDCQESHKIYQLALEQIARGRHDAAFAAFVYQEQNKTTQIELQCRQCLNLPQAK